MIWKKTDEATASSASVVATAMVIGPFLWRNWECHLEDYPLKLVTLILLKNSPGRNHTMYIVRYMNLKMDCIFLLKYVLSHLNALIVWFAWYPAWLSFHF